MIANLARTRVREGVVSYLEVLDVERNLFAAEQALLALRRAQADNLVTPYVALGGGEAKPMHKSTAVRSLIIAAAASGQEFLRQYSCKERR